MHACQITWLSFKVLFHILGPRRQFASFYQKFQKTTFCSFLFFSLLSREENSYYILYFFWYSVALHFFHFLVTGMILILLSLFLCRCGGSTLALNYLEIYSDIIKHIYDQVYKFILFLQIFLLYLLCLYTSKIHQFVQLIE